MSSYNGRRVPNFSQFLDDLNTIPSPYDQALQQQDDSFNIDAELALFTNTEFLDFDSHGDMSIPLTYEPLEEERSQLQNVVEAKNVGTDYLDLLTTDLPNVSDFPSSEFTDITPPSMQITLTFPQVHDTSSNGVSEPTPITPQVPSTPVPAADANPAAAATPTTPAGSKRKQPSHSDGPKSLDEAARIAAEEDKRRRNTAASARFRIKKKQREQALERTVKEAAEKNAVLEARVSQLELENLWLKNLVTEKNSGDSSNDSEKKEKDIADMFKKFLATQNTGSLPTFSDSKSGAGVRI
ncbi:hypothetical protein Egran_01548 [Elaphomyces granulatus]|uniref:BZIP domain-containing protein n=1 Tax=Elaphomyces granulatus TaxID=519963 RepID=A0A232M2S8_9EURO|nr:hypothetical protein Egran_01548 [Elaphomyces granulatus]